MGNNTKQTNGGNQDSEPRNDEATNGAATAANENRSGAGDSRVPNESGEDQVNEDPDGLATEDEDEEDAEGPDDIDDAVEDGGEPNRLTDK